MYIKHDIVFINDSQEDVVNHCCKLCKYVLKSKTDYQNSKEHGCCEECWLTFGQMRQKEWEEGWRPDSETLNRYKQSRRIININIMKFLGE